MKLPFLTDIIDAARFLKAYRETVGDPFDAASVIRPDPASRLIQLGQKKLPPAKDHKSLMQRYAGWSYICASRNAASIASVPLKLYATRATGEQKAGRGLKTIAKPTDRKTLARLQGKYPRHKALQLAEEVEEVVEHPVLDLLQNVNPSANRFDATETTSIFMDCVGNAYWYVARDNLGLPREFYVLLSQWMFVVPDAEKIVKGYLYGLDPKTQTAFEPDDIIHFRTPNPLSQFYGLGCIEAALMAVDRYAAMDNYEQSLNENMGVPSLWVQYKTGQLDQGKRLELEQQWNARFKGVKRAGKVAVTDNEYDIKEIGMAPREMGFSEGRRWTRLEIADAFGVPLALLDTENVNLANAQTALYQYMKFGIQPRLKRIEEKLNERLIPYYDEPRLVLAFDNCVPADQEFELREDQAYLNAGVVTVNEVRQRKGLDPVEWGDEPLRATVTMAEPQGEETPNEYEQQDKPDKCYHRRGKTAKRIRVKALPDTSDKGAILNALLASEYRAAYVYFSTAQIVLGPSRTVIAEEYMAHASEEMGHATRLMERLQELYLPVLTSMAAITSEGPTGPLPETTSDTLAMNIRLEREAVEDYREALTRIKDDPVTSLMLTELMGAEATHVHDLEQLASEVPKGIMSISARRKSAVGPGTVEPLTRNQQRLAKSMRAVFTMQETTALKWLDEHSLLFKQKAAVPERIWNDEWDGVIVKMCHEPIRKEFDDGTRQAVRKMSGKKSLKAKPKIDLADANNWVNRPEMSTYVRTHTMKFAKAINQTTHDNLRDIIADGIDNEVSIEDMRGQIEDLFKTYDDYRVDRIARTETARAFVGGERQAYKDSGVVSTLRWLASGDACEFCRSINGKTVSVDHPFFKTGDSIVLSDGKTMHLDYGETEGPPLHPNCLTGETPVLAVDKFAGIVAPYIGPVVEILLADGRWLSVTPNHMLLTPLGFMAAQFLCKGDNVLACSDLERVVSRYPNNDRLVSRIDDAVESLEESSGMASIRMPVTAKDLHGDARFVNGNVNVVRAYRELKGHGQQAVNISLTDKVRKASFGSVRKSGVSVSGFCSLAEFLHGAALASDGSMGRRREAVAFAGSRLLHPERHGFAPVAPANTKTTQAERNAAAVAPVMLGKFLDAHPGIVAAQKIVRINVRTIASHVYDLQCLSTMYIANGILSSNCRCDVIPEISEPESE